MTYKLRKEFTTLRSRYNPQVEVKMPCARKYLDAYPSNNKPYPIFPGLRNPGSTKKKAGSDNK